MRPMAQASRSLHEPLHDCRAEIGEDVALGGEVDGFVLNRPSLSFRMTCTTGFDQRRRAAWRPGLSFRCC
jgi:hypothetical protein